MQPSEVECAHHLHDTTIRAILALIFAIFTSRDIHRMNMLRGAVGRVGGAMFGEARAALTGRGMAI